MIEPSIRRALRAPRALSFFSTVLALAGCNAEPSVVQQADKAEPALTSNDQADAVPVIASDEATFDFGTVSPTGKVEHVFKLVNRGNADSEWGEWFYGLGWMSGGVPSIAVPGNHEYSSLNKDDKRGLTKHWRPQFELPENGPMGLEESVFYVDVQGLRIVGLNSNEEQEMQAAWLEEILQNNPNRWTIVTHHHPIHSTSRGRDNEHLRRLWQPLYDKYKVDLVLQGHDHSYGRSGPLGDRNMKVGQIHTGKVVALGCHDAFQRVCRPQRRMRGDERRIIGPGAGESREILAGGHR